MSEPKIPIANITPFGLRMQPDLKARVEEAASASGRSMNAEIVDRLEGSFNSWPYVALEPHIRARSKYLTPDQKDICNIEISKYANDIVFGLLPDENMELTYLEAALDRIVEMSSSESRHVLAANIEGFFQAYVPLLSPESKPEAERIFQQRLKAMKAKGD